MNADRITNFAYNWRDQKWHECAVVQEKALATLEIEWLSGPEKDHRETIVAENVARRVLAPPPREVPAVERQKEPGCPGGPACWCY